MFDGIPPIDTRGAPCNVDAATVEERVRLADAAIVATPRYSDSLKEISSFISRGPTTSTSRGVMLVGDSGVGKTTIVQELERAYPRVEHDEWTEVSLLSCSVPANTSIKDFSETVLIGLGDDAASVGTTAKKTARVLHFLDACKTRAFVVDEAQNFVERRTDRRVRATAEWFRDVVDRSKIPTILVGLEETTNLLRANRPLRRRFSAILRLNRYDCLNEVEFTEFRDLLANLQKALGLKEDSALGSPERAMKSFFATDGLIGYVKKLLTGAMRRALFGGREKILDSDLSMAFISDVYPGAPEISNPFSGKFQTRRLDGPGEPFELDTELSAKGRSQ